MAEKSEDLITKLAPVEFDASAKAPKFMKFLKQTLVDPELIAFVQRYLGYSLTSSTEERTMAVLHGVGKNGKSTLVELFQDLLGDYSSVANANTIMKQMFSDTTAQYQLAALKGRRFVTISETKRGVELEESTVKQITGNDTISARAPYGEPFTYRPQFKLWMSTNHKPEIPDGSEATWDRMRLIPFTQRFDEKRADPKLPQKLREELSGVLAWAVAGCVAWGEQGLGSAKAVDRATAEYRAETDVLERFFEDECEFGPKKSGTKSALWEAYVRWCDAEGVDEGTQIGFSRVVKERGVVKGFREERLGSRVRIWAGVALHPHSPDGVDEGKKSCKHGGVVDSFDNSDNYSETFVEQPPREEVLENREKVDEVVDGPLTWVDDGVEWKYIPYEESD